MIKPINFDVAKFQEVVAKLKPYIEFTAEGEVQDEPWTDESTFRKWLKDSGFSSEDTNTLCDIIPSVTLAMNHGALYGVERFIDENSETGHKVLSAGFIIVGSGPNGDFVVVDVTDGRGDTGWLPMAMIWDMSAKQVREHFIATSESLGSFMRSSETDWSTVPKDWYDAKAKLPK